MLKILTDALVKSGVIFHSGDEIFNAMKEDVDLRPMLEDAAKILAAKIVEAAC